MGSGKRLFPLREVPAGEVQVGERHRKDMGDLQALADSIALVGLIHPIGVTADNRLVVGERRLRAVRDILKWETVPALVLDVDAVRAEHDENEVRKQFTASERVAIAKAFTGQIGERRGKPVAADNVQKIAQLEPGQKTREAAAKKAGFGNRETLRQAASVVEKGTPALVEAMDEGTLSVAAAAETAKLSPEKQGEVVSAVKTGRKPRQAIAEARDETPPAPERPASPLDAWGIPVQPHAREAFAAREKFDELLSLLRKAQKLFNEVANLPGGKFLTLPGVSSYRRGRKGEDGSHADRFVHEGLERAAAQVKAAAPAHTVCPYQYAETPHRDDCPTCHNLNWTPALGSSVPESCAARARAAFGVKEAG